MSAGTMLALGCDEIVMGTHSQLGPIDPQFTITTADGVRQAPAEAILQQFERAKREIDANPRTAGAWLPILSGYGPGLLSRCDIERELGKELVREWLENYMLAGEADAGSRAQAAVEFFSDYKSRRTHGRPIRRENLRALGLKVVDLEADQAYQDLALSVHHATMHTLATYPISKIIENHTGRAFIRWIGPPIQLALAPGPGGSAPQARVEAPLPDAHSPAPPAKQQAVRRRRARRN
jgi:hypothetical protein